MNPLVFWQITLKKRLPVDKNCCCWYGTDGILQKQGKVASDVETILPFSICFIKHSTVNRELILTKVQLTIHVPFINDGMICTYSILS